MFQFCSSCGRYWSPGNKQQAAERNKQVCSPCQARVEYSWLGYGLAAVLMYLLLATALFPTSRRVAPVLLAVTLVLAVYKAIRQRRIRHAFDARR